MATSMPIPSKRIQAALKANLIPILTDILMLRIGLARDDAQSMATAAGKNKRWVPSDVTYIFGTLYTGAVAGWALREMQEGEGGKSTPRRPRSPRVIPA
jgi:hypothetical protein